MLVILGHARSGKSITKRQQNHKTTAGLPVQVFGPRFGPPCCVFSLFSSARCLALFHPLLELLPGAARLPRLNYLFAHVSRCFRPASLSPPKPAESNGARPTPSRCRCHRPGGDTPRARGVSLRTVPCARSRDAGRSGQFLRRSAGRRSCSERSAPAVSSGVFRDRRAPLRGHRQGGNPRPPRICRREIRPAAGRGGRNNENAKAETKKEGRVTK